MLTACNYLVCTINDAVKEASSKYALRVCHCLTPYIVLQPVIFILSRVVTNNERFLVTFTKDFMLAWIVVLIVVTIKELNNITVKATFKVIFLTLFAALIFIPLVFILYILWQQVYEFVTGIGGEVVYRLASRKGALSKSNYLLIVYRILCGSAYMDFVMSRSFSNQEET